MYQVQLLSSLNWRTISIPCSMYIISFELSQTEAKNYIKITSKNHLLLLRPNRPSPTPPHPHQTTYQAQLTTPDT